MTKSRGLRRSFKDRGATMEEKFLNRTLKTDGCWIWQGNRDRNGYGLFTHKGVYFCDFAHRVSYTIHVGPIQEGLVICHRCDNPPCVNPDHLFQGTQRDNQEDAQKKERTRILKGAAHWAAVLNLEQVVEIKRRLASYSPGLTTALAKEFGVSVPTIKAIKAGRNWSHVP